MLYLNRNCVSLTDVESTNSINNSSLRMNCELVTAVLRNANQGILQATVISPIFILCLNLQEKKQLLINFCLSSLIILSTCVTIRLELPAGNNIGFIDLNLGELSLTSIIRTDKASGAVGERPFNFRAVPCLV